MSFSLYSVLYSCYSPILANGRSCQAFPHVRYRKGLGNRLLRQDLHSLSFCDPSRWAPLGLDLDECGCHSVRESDKLKDQYQRCSDRFRLDFEGGKIYFFVFLNPPDGRWDKLDLSGRDRRENSLAFWRIPSLKLFLSARNSTSAPSESYLPTPGRLPHCLPPTALDDGGSRRGDDKGKNVE
jgi:hypothetical protein